MATKRSKRATRSSGSTKGKPPVRRRTPSPPTAPTEPIVPPPAPVVIVEDPTQGLPVMETPATTPEPAVPKKKVVLVDGPSFYHPNQRRGLSWGQINWATLASILAQEIGSGGTTAPTYTVPPDLDEGFQKVIRVSGFQVEPVDPAFEGDDRFLIAKIKALNPSEVGTLVLVTYDGSFVEAAREAKTKGITVVWVASVHPTDRRGNLVMGLETQSVVKNEFEFVDLRDSGIADRVRRREWQENFRERGQALQRAEQKTVVTFRVEIPTRDLASVMTQLQSMVEKYDVNVKFEN